MTTLLDDLPETIYFKIERRPGGQWWGWAKHEEILEDGRSGGTETLAMIQDAPGARRCLEGLLDLLGEDEDED